MNQALFKIIWLVNYDRRYGLGLGHTSGNIVPNRKCSGIQKREAKSTFNTYLVMYVDGGK